MVDFCLFGGSNTVSVEGKLRFSLSVSHYYFLAIGNVWKGCSCK